MDLARAPRRAPLTARKKGSGYENGPQRDVTKQRHIWRSKIATRYRIIWEMRYFVRLSRLQYNFNLFFEV